MKFSESKPLGDYGETLKEFNRILAEIGVEGLASEVVDCYKAGWAEEEKLTMVKYNPKSGDIQLCVTERFFELPPEDQIGLLTHEACHVWAWQQGSVRHNSKIFKECLERYGGIKHTGQLKKPIYKVYMNVKPRGRYHLVATFGNKEEALRTVTVSYTHLTLPTILLV